MTPLEATEIRPMLRGGPLCSPDLLELCEGSQLAALFLYQLLYWTPFARLPDGWIYKTDDEWRAEVGFTRSQLDTIRKLVTRLGFVEVQRRGMCGKNHYRLTEVFVGAALRSIKGGPRGTSKPECGHSANRGAENRQSGLPKAGSANKEAETTAEITPETTPRIRPANRPIDQSSERAIDVNGIAEELSQMIGPTDRQVALRIVRACLAVRPDMTTEEIVSLLGIAVVLCRNKKNSIDCLVHTMANYAMSDQLDSIRAVARCRWGNNTGKEPHQRQQVGISEARGRETEQ